MGWSERSCGYLGMSVDRVVLEVEMKHLLDAAEGAPLPQTVGEPPLSSEEQEAQLVKAVNGFLQDVLDDPDQYGVRHSTGERLESIDELTSAYWDGDLIQVYVDHEIRELKRNAFVSKPVRS